MLIILMKRKTTKEGFEYHFGINHYGTFRLTIGLLPIIVNTSKEYDDVRIVNVSSKAHTSGKINFDDVNYEKNSFSAFGAYSQSKLANVMFSNELNRKLENLKIPVTVNSLHPGGINTDIFRDLGFIKTALNIAGPLFLKSIPQGTATTIYAAIHPELKGKGGIYLDDCNIAEPSEYSKNEKEQINLFDLSEKVTGVSFPKFE
jgi:NAD(P)-dependent dehydrogenase (short-subunit alcohol dehydrogenase family)